MRFLCRLLLFVSAFVSASSIVTAQPPLDACDPACGLGFECMDGACTAAPAASNSVTPACVPDCRQGYACQAGVCMQMAGSCVPDCRSGFACQSGVCVAAVAAVAPAPVALTAVPIVDARPQAVVANDVEQTPDGALPLRFTARPLTLPQGTLVTGVGLAIAAVRAGSSRDIYSSMGVGVHLGIIDALQFSLFPIQLGLSPDLEVFDPRLALRAAFVRSSVFQMGASYGLRIPIADDGVGAVNTLQLDFLVRSSVFRFDAAIFASFSSYSVGAGPEGEGGSSEVVIGSGLSMGVGFQLASIVALHFGLEHSMVDANPDTYRLSFAPSFIFAVPRRDGTPFMDINVGVGLPGLIGTSRSDVVDARIIQSFVDVKFYNDLY